jgi:hypothetical protein
MIFIRKKESGKNWMIEWLFGVTFFFLLNLHRKARGGLWVVIFQ